MKVYDFKCSNGHVFEEFTKQDISVSRCACGANAKRLVSSPRFRLDGSSGDFPGAHMKWVKEHEAAGKQAVEESE
jgi:hypothetical protein